MRRSYTKLLKQTHNIKMTQNWIFILVVYIFSAFRVTECAASQVAFSAGLTYTMHARIGETVPFNKVFVNVGSGYDDHTGIFTCPIPGIYIFHFHAYDMNKDKAMWLELLHNSNFIASVSGYNSHSSGGNTVMLKLRRGDKVQIKARDQQQFSLFGQPDEIYSTFTGFLLIPQVPNDGPAVGK